MILGRTGQGNRGALGQPERLLAAILLAVMLVSIVASLGGVAQARMDASDPEQYERAMRRLESRIFAFYGWYHSVGQLLLHVSNQGYFGDWDADITSPSAEWPAGSDIEYLYAGGLWVGGIVRNHETGHLETRVSAAVFQQEYMANPQSPLATIYESWEGAANSGRIYDDDDDCRPWEPDPFNRYDEDPLDGIDNDGDTRIDEDYAAISQQMYRTEYVDTYEEEVNENAPAGDEHHALGLKVIQESYQWTSALTDDFVGIDFTVVNIGEDTIRMVYVGFMVDADVGPESDQAFPYADDLGGFLDTRVVTVNPNDPSLTDTLEITLGYMHDAPAGQDGSVAQGYFGCMFLGHPTSNPDTLQPGNMPNAPTEVRVHSFEVWSSGAEDPENDEGRYRYLQGDADYPLLDGLDNDGDGSTDESDEWLVNIDGGADTPQDWRFMLSAGPFREVLPGDTLVFQYAFVAGLGEAGMLANAATAQQIYNGISPEFSNCVGDADTVLVHWVADTPPPPPNQEITAGDRFVQIEWDDYPEDIADPLTRDKDFFGYQVWKAVGWTRESSEPRDQDWELILDVDRRAGGAELDELDTGLEGVGKYSFIDPNVRDGFAYWYSVTAYDSTWTETGGTVYHYGKYTQNKALVFPHSGVRNTLDDVVVVPNPYVNHEYMAAWNLEPDETDPTGEKVCFHHLPRDSVVRIYSLGGELVDTLYPDAELTGGDACWDMISRNNQIVVSGVYLYHVDSPIGQKQGKLVIVR